MSGRIRRGELQHRGNKWKGVLPAIAIVCCSLLTLPLGAQEPSPSDSRTVSITIDLSKPIGPYKPLYSWFGYDEANYTTAPHGRALLRELHDLSPVPVYIRVHHLLTSGDGTPELKWSSTGVYREDANGKPVYNFAILDGIFDTFRASGVRPMVEFGFMPKDLAAQQPNRPEYQVHFPKSTISGSVNNPPKDYAKWGELIRVITEHLVERYGRETVQQWYFEVWNEPDIDYWHGTPEGYWKLYDYAVAGIRKALPDARVGGPASTGPSSPHAYDFLKGFLDHIANGKSATDGGPIPLDFISFHVKGHPTIVEGNVTMGIDHELSDADRGFSLIAQYPHFKNLPIILSEADPEGCAACSSRQNPANNYRNGTLYPAYTAAAYKALFDLQDRHRVDLISMLSWSFEFENRDYFEGFRSLASNGVDKPILNLFRMLALMNGQRVMTTSSGRVPLETMVQIGARQDPDTDAMATIGDHQAAVLLWNYHDAALSRVSAATTVYIGGIPKDVKRVLIERFRIDNSHSNASSVWRTMGSPQQPTPEQYAKLQAAGQLQLLTSPQWIDVADGIATIESKLPPQSVELLRLTWQEPMH